MSFCQFCEFEYLQALDQQPKQPQEARAPAKELVQRFYKVA
jgi:hypothetical protein